MIAIFAGDKGGLGKSMVARAFADRLLRLPTPLFTVDADKRNASIYNMFNTHAADAKRIFLETHSGWLDLVDAIEDHPGHNVIVDLPAGAGGAFLAEFPLFAPTARDILKHEIALFWVLDRMDDTINLLRLALPAILGNVDHLFAVRNLMWGAPEVFGRWRNSEKVRPPFEEAGGLTIDFPELTERTHDNVISLVMPPFSRILADPIGRKIRMTDAQELERWLATADRLFETILPELFTTTAPEVLAS